MLTGRGVTLVLATQEDKKIIEEIAAAGKEWLFWDAGTIALDDIFRTLVAASPGTISRLWTINKADKIVGFISLNDVDPIHRGGEIRYTAIRRGAATVWDLLDAIFTLGEFGYTTLGLHRIYAKVFASHPVLHKLYKRAGLREEGRAIDAVYHGGKWETLVTYALTADEWKAR